MKANAGASILGRIPFLTSGSERLIQPLRMFPVRLREPRFWQIQAMVVMATAPHYIIETLGYTNPFETLHGLTITLYIIPLLYAALSYGWEGAVLTGLWAAVLTSPSMWIWHRSEYHWFTELAQLAITLPVGILVAWRVDLEAKQRRRAERTSASLSLLNEIGESLSHSLDVEAKLPEVLERLSSELSLDGAWLCLEPEAPQGELLVLAHAADGARSPSTLARRLHARVASASDVVRSDDRTVAVPLFVEGGLLGSLGATISSRESLEDEQVELLTTVAHQVSVAVENARLYRQRQESLQSYVRQVTQAQEEERLRIARDLHDDTAQELVGLVRSLEQLQQGSATAAAQPVDELLAQARATLQSVRRYSRDLRPSVLDDLGLVAALEVLVEGTNGRLTQGARLNMVGRPRRLNADVELALFRIAQEALRNVEKHAKATSATVDLNLDETEVRLDIVDNGCGFEVPKSLPELVGIGKLGMLGMKERAELVGGTFLAHSTPGEGTRLTVTVISEPE